MKPLSEDKSDERPDVKLGFLQGSLAYQLRIAQALATQVLHRNAEGSLPVGRISVLVLISQNPGITQTALSFASGRDTSSMTPVLDDLVKRGLVARSRVNTNRRAYALNLTAAGWRAHQETMDIARRHEAELDGAIGADKAEFLRMLRKLNSRLSKLMAVKLT
jgi:DNA-binding MarR family transcriptional regulator